LVYRGDKGLESKLPNRVGKKYILRDIYLLHTKVTEIKLQRLDKGRMRGLEGLAKGLRSSLKA
jgi:hypothetical protein